MNGNAELVNAHGVFLEYSDGTKVIDGSNTGAPLGHSHPAIVEAVREAAVFPVANEGQPWFERRLAAAELSDLLNVAAGEEWVGEVHFGLSGSEVNDIALSLAQSLSNRASFVVRDRAYHGLVGLSRDATVQPQWHGGLSFISEPRHVQAPPRAVPVQIINPPDGAIWERNQPKRSNVELNLSANCDEAMKDAAAVIIDYTQGGRYYDDPIYQDTVANRARAAGAYWIADEVVTGLGRCGSMFAFEQGNTIPDIVTMGKPLAGGATPGGAVILSKRVVNEMKQARWQNYSTFRGHPVMVHAMRRHLQIMSREGLPQRAAELGSYCSQILRQMANVHPCITRIAGKGLHWTVEFEGKDWKAWDSTEMGPNIADFVVKECEHYGARISTSDEPSSLFIAPSLIISRNELDHLFDALDRGLVAGDKYLQNQKQS
ncbi:aminotransferase class III-fold pyridoxal phosphate-dependent enzyme [Bifidobacterium aquikefiri]|uniref:aminotransferase class III-fold pyridoxal phosphate-dependent enzyme n=1 Tax=Bifidobacterium aquikefiri TaxID=1653207 RepID=UPI0039EB6D45